MVIEVTGLSKRYGQAFAVKGASFTVQPGQVTGFLGPNGAGKSTTMRCIVGLDHPTSGQALIGGKRYAQLVAPLREVGALLDEGAAHRSRTAWNYLASIAATHRIGRSRITEVLGRTGLTGVAGRKVGGFSLGMRQRLGIAAALLGDPQILILDEPVNGLDPEGVTWVRNLLRQLADEGRTVFLSSHLLSELALIADHFVIIGRGRIIADAPLSELTGDQRPRVLVRTNRAQELVELLASDRVTTHSDQRGLLEFEGITAEQIAVRAFDNGIVLHELAPVHQTLEDAYNAITRDAVEYTSTSYQ